MTSEDITVIDQSLKRCNRNPQFLDLFYEFFFNASPEVASHFAHTDMMRQKRMLEASLYTCILASEAVPYAVSSIKHLGEIHRDRAIRPALYEIWLDSLIQAVATCDEEFNQQLEDAWRLVMRNGIEQMLAMYTVHE